MSTSAKNRALWILAGLGAVGTCVFFRLYPVTVYPVYSAKNNAELIVYSQIRRAVEQKVRAVYPKEPLETREKIIARETRKFLNTEKNRINSLIGTLTQKILNEKPRVSGYLLEADPYYYLALTRNLVEKGKIAEKVSGHRYFNEKTLAPNGGWYPLDYHPYTGLLAYRALRVFQPNLSLNTAVSAVPVALAALCALAFLFVLGRVLGLGVLPAFLSTLYLLSVPMFLKRSLFGWYDTDPYNVLFPTLILGALFACFSNGKKFEQRLQFLCLAVFLTAVYSLFWRGFALMFSTFAVSLVIFSVTKKEVRLFSLVYLLSPLVFYPLLWGAGGFQDVVKESAQFVRNFFHPAIGLWPDVFLSVGELKPGSWHSLFELVGNPFFMLFSMLGIAVEMKRKTAAAVTAGVFLITLFLAMNFERFCVLMVVPVSIGFALGLGRCFESAKTAKIILSAALVTALFVQSHLTARFEHPIYNSSWDRIMKTLKEKTPGNSIVTTWWSPGHFITAMAGRRVTFDGATQNTPQAYFVSKLFLADSEETCLRILRLLNNGIERPLDYLKNKGFEGARAVDLLFAALPGNENNATLKKFLKPQEAEYFLSLVRGTGPRAPSYLFIYDDMVANALALVYIGNWDFRKAENFNALIRKYPHVVPKSFLKRASKENVGLTWSISGGPWAQSPEAYESGRDERFIYFPNGLKLAQDFSGAEIASKEFGSGKPKSIFTMKEGIIQENRLPGATLRISALVIEEPSGCKTVLADERLIRSMLFRLFYFKGKGLRHIRLLAGEESLENRNRMYVFEAEDWP